MTADESVNNKKDQAWLEQVGKGLGLVFWGMLLVYLIPCLMRIGAPPVIELLANPDDNLELHKALWTVYGWLDSSVILAGFILATVGVWGITRTQEHPLSATWRTPALRWAFVVRLAVEVLVGGHACRACFCVASGNFESWSVSKALPPSFTSCTHERLGGQWEDS